jgi:hypothetical protein
VSEYLTKYNENVILQSTQCDKLCKTMSFSVEVGH